MEWGKLFKSSSAEKREQRKNSSDTAKNLDSPHNDRRRASPPESSSSSNSNPLPPKKPSSSTTTTTSSSSRSAVSSPVLSPRTLTQIVQLTKDQKGGGGDLLAGGAASSHHEHGGAVRSSPMATATAAVIDRSLMEAARRFPPSPSSHSGSVLSSTSSAGRGGGGGGGAGSSNEEMLLSSSSSSGAGSTDELLARSGFWRVVLDYVCARCGVAFVWLLLVAGAILTTMLATRNFSIPKMDANSRSLTAKKVGEVTDAVPLANLDLNNVTVPTSTDTITEEDGCETPKLPFPAAGFGGQTNHLDNGHHRGDTGYSSSSSLPRDNQTTAKRLEIVRVTQALLDSIATGAYEQYSKFCDPSMTAFEPESLSNLVEGMDFHKFYFENHVYRNLKSIRSTMLHPNIQIIGEDSACISYVRLDQFVDKTGAAGTQQFEETRVWQKRDSRWLLVHSHRSGGRVTGKAS
ncbi:putative Calcium/calmodulin-dependent protein kinase type II subunit beta [Hypsibius exemplaris]|uniref:Calcium/calmodulin-dependent protein kinase type II subunit beta n=1 Tax=Hypsibius exemplaris TaxID=2072580 RepID=A0A1W0WUD5_HYPEX|nr:putative Calcium/calmodulin-dependent protein kinase type II subunit beta [Hypsibius exemplaris]